MLKGYVDFLEALFEGSGVFPRIVTFNGRCNRSYKGSGYRSRENVNINSAQKGLAQIPPEVLRASNSSKVNIDFNKRDGTKPIMSAWDAGMAE